MRIAAIAIVASFFAAASFSASAQQSALAKQSLSHSTPPSPQQLYQALASLQLDTSKVYSVRDISIRRDGVEVFFENGKLAFLQPIEGQITGAVFSGHGRIFAVPPDPAERASLAQYLKVPLIDVDFGQAYFRFDSVTENRIAEQVSDEKALATNDADLAAAWSPIIFGLNLSSTPRVFEGLLSAQPTAYFYAAVSSTQFGGFDVVVDESRAEAVLIGQPRRVNNEDFFNVWTSYKPVNAPAPLENFAIISDMQDTTIEEDLTLAAGAVLKLKCLIGGERVLNLELSRFLEVKSVTDAHGNALAFFQNEDIRRQDIARRGNDALYVVLPKQATAGASYELHFKYQGTVIEDDGNGVYFVGARGSWYPHLSGTPQFSSFDLKFRWPKKLRLVATGKEISRGEDGNQLTGEWRSTEPFIFAGFNLGEYATETVAGKPEIQLFANQQLEQSIANLLQQNAGRPPLPLPRFLRPLPTPAAVLKDLGKNLLDSVRYYERWNGPFPFPELDVSQIPGTFGQGWPGLLYLTTFVFLSPQAQAQAGLPQISQEEVQRLVPFHEVVHQWWGNVIAPASYRDNWIVEGMADYQSLMYDQEKKRSKPALQTWLLLYRDALTAKEPGTGKAVDAAGPLDFGYRLNSSNTPNAYRIITYEKGAWVIHMLRMMLREPRAKNPDARFEKLLKNMLARYREKTFSARDFQTEVEQLMTPSMDLENSRSMDWFFDQWVRQTGIPEYSADFTVHERKSGVLVEGVLHQRGVSNVFTERVPIYGVEPQGKKVFLGTVVTTGAMTSFRFAMRVRPVKLAIDPEHTILCRTK
ncbi:MAG TPA: M1 family aminopeptidase [Candidatus Acidoferrales bacterium]|nr:M1 family aminopeptidase [Candidatus Acidoferrales bacterium]